MERLSLVRDERQFSPPTWDYLSTRDLCISRPLWFINSNRPRLIEFFFLYFLAETSSSRFRVIVFCSSRIERGEGEIIAKEKNTVDDKDTKEKEKLFRITMMMKSCVVIIIINN